MSRTILVIGESGSGKSTSMKNLHPEETLLINVIGKDLPFQGWKKHYKVYNKETKEGNIIVTHEPSVICKAMLDLAKPNQNIKVVVIDDFQYIMSYEFMKRAKEQGWQKFTDIGQNAFNVFQTAEQLRPDQTVIILAHSEEIYQDSGRKTKIKTIGKMLDEKITPEGLFTIVLLSAPEKTVEGVKYWFYTKSDGSSTAKTPDGMFPEKIPNDLQAVLDRIEEYNNG